MDECFYRELLQHSRSARQQYRGAAFSLGFFMGWAGLHLPPGGDCCTNGHTRGWESDGNAVVLDLEPAARPGLSADRGGVPRRHPRRGVARAGGRAEGGVAGPRRRDRRQIQGARGRPPSRLPRRPGGQHRCRQPGGRRHRHPPGRARRLVLDVGFGASGHVVPHEFRLLRRQAGPARCGAGAVRHAHALFGHPSGRSLEAHGGGAGGADDGQGHGDRQPDPGQFPGPRHFRGNRVGRFLRRRRAGVLGGLGGGRRPAHHRQRKHRGGALDDGRLSGAGW